MIINLNRLKEKYVNYNSNLYNNTMSFQDIDKDVLWEDKSLFRKMSKEEG
jgi:membrane-bound lytic murein transglycosylase MltF